MTVTVDDVLEGADAERQNSPAHVAFSMHVDDLYMEAENWCDGEPLTTQEQADTLTALISKLETASKDAEKYRTTEKAPHLEAGRVIDGNWKPITDKAAKAVKAAKRALTPWLQALKAEQDRIADEKRRIADEAAKRLREQAEAERRSSDLADSDVREALEAEVKAAEKNAKRAERTTAVSKGEGRTVAMRDFWLVAVKDNRELLTHYLKNRPEVAEELRGWLFDQAKKDVRSGARTIPGCSIWNEPRAV